MLANEPGTPFPRPRPMSTRSLLLPAAAALLAGPAGAQAQLRTDLPAVTAMAPDGVTYVGFDAGGAWLWSDAGGFTPIGGETAVALANDGSAVAGNRTGTTGFDGPAHWDAVHGWTDLGGLPNQTPPSGSHGSAYDISADGTVVVGLGWRTDFKARGFRWDAVNGLVELPQLGTRSSRASAISGDGQWIGGFDEHSTGVRRAALWDANRNETLFLVRPENPEGYGEIHNINSDGSVIVGMDTLPTENGSGFVWTQSGGVTRFGPVEGVDPGLNYNWAAAASEDGSVVVGGNWDLFLNTTYATLWTEATGNVLLSEHLTDLGVTGLDQVQLASATHVSADGTRIMGWGVEFPFTFIQWEATLPGCEGGTVSFCITAANSVGPGATIASNGATSVGENAFELTAGPVPDQPGLFFFSSARQMPAGLGDGFLCVGNGQQIFRLPAVVAAGNVLSHTVDLDAPPSAGRLLPGTTWYFQAWYRDPAANGAGSNLSDGLAVTFCR